ncbi:MAG: amino acid permease, partial [Chitinophagales bacterium]
MKKMNFWLGLLVPTLLFATAIATYLLHFPFQQWVHQNISLVTGIGGGAIALLVGLWWWMNRKNKAKLLTTSSSKTDNAAIITKPKQKTKNKKQPVKFGTFQGVFTPVLLTILGVIMYLREGWVVGNAGLLGAIGIILLASVITFFTALSMSSITTNIRIGAGGAFSIIAQSLGMEAGGAIGIPLYFAQALAVAMYIFGFREGWCWAFPDHSYLLVDCVTFAFVFLIVNISTDFAFKIQYFIMAIIVGSLFSIVGALFTSELNYDFQLFGSYPGSPDNNFSGSSFWLVFAVYFPAVTGIMAGANMSGDLKDPRVNIPSGTLAAIVITTIVYIFLAVVLALLATPEELVGNYNILIDKALWAPIVLAGLLGATFSSALSSLVGAPRILQALGQNNILFFNKQLTQLDDKGEPKNALLVTVALVVGALLMRDLNAIAPLITMF